MGADIKNMKDLQKEQADVLNAMVKNRGNRVPDVKKVIKGLKYLHDKDSWREGIMIHDDHAHVRKQICSDAIELLKEQQAEIEALKTGFTWGKLKDGVQE